MPHPDKILTGCQIHSDLCVQTLATVVIAGDFIRLAVWPEQVQEHISHTQCFDGVAALICHYKTVQVTFLLCRNSGIQGRLIHNDLWNNGQGSAIVIPADLDLIIAGQLRTV